MPQYYKTSKGYCYKKTQKGEASRISTSAYEKAMVKQKGGVGKIHYDAMRTFTGHNNGILSVCVSEDGKHLFTGSYDTAKMWDVSTGLEMRTFTGHHNDDDCLTGCGACLCQAIIFSRGLTTKLQESGVLLKLNKHINILEYNNI